MSKIIYNIIGGAVAVIFFITSTVSAAPLTSTLRPLAAAKEVAPHLEKELAEYLDKIPEASESTIKLVIFDWGKVLDNYDYGISAKKLAERCGIDEDLANKYFDERNTNPENPLYRYEHKITDEQQLLEETNNWLRQVGAERSDLSLTEYDEILNSSQLGDISESLTLVKALISKGYKVRVLTTTCNLFHQYRLTHSKLIQLLENGEKNIYASHLRKFQKPDMRSYLEIVEDAGLSPEEALFVDDRGDCIDGAKRVGLKAFLFNPKEIAGSIKGIVNDLEASGTLKKFLDAIPPVSESSIKLVIFDQGNVVLRYDYEKIAEELHRRFGIDKKIALDFCEGRHSDTENPLYQYEHDEINERKFAAAVKDWLEDNLHEKIKFTLKDSRFLFIEKILIGNIPETVALIKTLKAKGYKIGGLATLSRAFAEYYSDPANRIGLTPLLEKPKHFHGSCYRKYAKPHPRSYLDLVEEAEISANEAYFIDDRQDCVAGAVVAGLMVRLFNPENALGSVRDIAISLSKDGSALEGLDLYPESPLEFDDRIASVMIKPDAKKDRNALIKEFVDAGFEIVSVITPKEPLDLETWKLFYEEHRGKDFFDPAVHQFGSGEVTFVILRGEKDAYRRVREMIGPWRITKPGTLRRKYGVQADAIVTYVDDSGQMQRKPFYLSKIHGADNSRAVLREIGLTHGRDNLSRIFKVSNMPEARSAEEYLAELKKRFSIEPGEVADMKSRFAGYLKSALSEEPSEIRINKAHIGVPTGDEKGKYLRLEVGGTYVRVGLVELFGDHKYEIYPFELEKKIPPELKKGDGARLFDFFAECIAEFIREYEAKEETGEGYELTFIFSFGLEKTAIDQAIIYEMTKEFRVTGVIGNNLKDLFHEALDRKGVENVRTVAVGNDTESLTAGAAYLYEYCILSMVLSTGYNIGLLTLGDIFNTEAGNWKDDIFLQNRSSFDIWLDLNSTQPIEYAAEKTLAGTYVGELVRVVLSDMISRGLLFNGQTSPIFNTPWALDTKYLDGIQRHPVGETAKIGEYIRTLGIKNVSGEDCRNVWKVADMVTTRAAQVVAVHLGAAIDNTDYDFTHVLNILSEGAFVEKSPVMQDKIKTVLTDLFGPKASKVHMVVNRDATKIGAGVMAAMAKSSSGGSTADADSSAKKAKPAFQLLDGVNVKLSNDIIYKGLIERVVTIADYSKTLVPGISPLEGEYLEVFVENLDASDLVIVITGDSFADIWRCLAKPLLARLQGGGRKLLNKLVVVYDNSEGAFKITPNGEGNNFWLPEELGLEERIGFTKGLISAFWEQIKNWQEQLGLPQADKIDAIKEQQLAEFRNSPLEKKDPKWKTATSDFPYYYYLSCKGDEFGLYDLLGSIYITDTGSMLCLEFNYASEKLIQALGGNTALPLTERIAKQVHQAVKAEKIKHIIPGPSFVDLTQVKKDDGILRLLGIQKIRDLISKGKVAILLIGDSGNDFHLNLTKEAFAKFGIDALPIPIFVGKDEEVVGLFKTYPVITIPKEDDGGVVALKAAAQMRGRDLSEVIVRASSGGSGSVDSYAQIRSQQQQVHDGQLREGVRGRRFPTQVSEIEKLISGKKPEEVSVLDLGCGAGFGGSLDLARKNYNITAVDFSKTALNIFSQSLAKENISNTKLIQSDLVDFLRDRALDKSFDVVHAKLSLQYFDDATTRFIFERIFEVLKPGGVFALQVVSVNDERFLKRQDMRDYPGEKNMVIFTKGSRKGEIRRFFSEDYLKRLLDEFGVEVLREIPLQEGRRHLTAVAIKPRSSSAGSASVREILKPLDSPIIFNVSSMPIQEPKLSDYAEFRKSLLEKKGFYPSSFVENFQTRRDTKGQEYVLKPDASKEALAYYFARAVGFDDISKALLIIAPDGMYASGLKSYGLIEYYNGITFSKTDKRFPRITIDSKLYKEHPKLRDLNLEGIDFEAWFKVLQDPAQIVSGDLFRIFSNNLESTWARNLIYKKLDNDKVEIRFIDYQPAFADKGFDEKEVISHLKKYASYYLKYCPELLRNIVNLSDEDIEYIVRWVYRQELLNVRIAVARPEELIKNIKDSRDLIKEVLGEEIAKIKVTGKAVATVSTVTRPTEQLRDLHIGHSKDTKSSSAGTFEVLDKEILAAQDILLGARPDELNYKHIEQTQAKLRQLRSQIRGTAKSKLPDKDRMILYSRLQAQENILNHMLIADAAARIGSDGQIVFDPSIILDEKQRNAVVRQFKAVQAALEGSMSSEDEDKVSTQVCLLEDILSDRVKLAKNAILISDKQKLQGARLLKIDGGINKDNSYLIAPYLIALARGLLSINENNYAQLINNIERLHFKITQQPLDKDLKQALKDGSFNIFPLIVDMLPGVETIDKDYIERLQRQAWAALIAA